MHTSRAKPEMYSHRVEGDHLVQGQFNWDNYIETLCKIAGAHTVRLDMILTIDIANIVSSPVIR
jgi:hypothetical protein